MATRRTRRPTQNGEQAPRLRMKDVAAKAGVSSATVSRVLNGADYVQPEYKERVLQAIAELGYRPNRLASNLRRSKTDMIGVVVPDIENPHFTEMVRAVEDAAYRLGYRVLLCNTDEADDKQASYLEMLAQERVLGIILTPCDANGQEISKVMDAGTPLVAFDRAVADSRADSVLIDNFGALHRGTQHLIAAGHGHIGYVGGTAEG